MTNSVRTSLDSLTCPLSCKYVPSATISGNNMAWNWPMVLTLEKPVSKTLGFSS